MIYHIYILLLLISIVWIWYFLWSGSIFLLDFVQVPIYSLHIDIFEKSFFGIFSDIFVYIMWSWLFSRIVFLLILLLWWYVWLLFWKFIFWRFVKKNNDIKPVIIFSSITFFMINPFMYERILTQPLVYLWVLVMILWMYYLFKDIEFKSRYWIYGFMLFWLAWTIMQQAIFFILLILVCFIIVYLRTWKQFWKILIWFIIVVLMNINWIAWGIFMESNDILHSLESFSKDNLTAFQTNWTDWIYPEITTLMLYGLWTERYLYTMLPQHINHIWFLSWFIVLVLAFYGLFYLYRNREYRKFAIFLSLLWVVSWILWVWISSYLFWWMVWLLYDHIPFYMWFRESHKWIWLWMFVLWLLSVIWLWNLFSLLWEYKKEYPFLNIIHWNYFFVMIFIIFIISWTPWVMFGFQWQLFFRDFPDSYKESRKLMLVDQGFNNYKFIVTPRHSYMWCNWTQWRIVTNVIDKFFKPLQVFVADNIEIAGIYTNFDNPLSRDVEKFLNSQDLGYLEKQWITHIINLKTCADFWNYEYLSSIARFDKIYESKEVDIYRINNNSWSDN